MDGGLYPEAASNRGEHLPTLVVTAPDAMRGQEFVLSGNQLTVGRASDSDLRIANPYVSRRHAVILRRSGELTIEDAHSAAGVLVNGVRLSAPTVLRAGDHVRVDAVDSS